MWLAGAFAADAAGLSARWRAAGRQNAAGYVDVVESYRREGERRGAVGELIGWPRESVREAVRGLDPRSATPRWRLAAMLLHGDVGMLARQRGDVDLGAFHFQVGLTLAEAPFDGESERRARRWLLAIGLFEASEGAAGDATAFLDGALGRFPDDPQLLLARGQIEELLATPRFRGWAPSRTSGAGGRRHTEEGMRQSSEIRARLSEAETLYRRALAADPSLLEARLHLGRVQHVRGRIDEAQESLEAVLASARSETYLAYMANLLLGGLLESAGELERAAARYRDAIDADPQSEVAVLALAHITRRLGQRREAAEMVEALLSRRATRGHTDGWWAFRMGPLADGDQVQPILRALRAEIAE